MIKNLKIYCITLNPLHKDLIKKLNYVPVGLGDADFNKSEWLTDFTGINIKEKNKYYGEYTFHYWLWKNNKLNFDGWIGFCQYRKFWKNNLQADHDKTIDNLNDLIMKEIPPELESYESILGLPLYVNNFRLSKFMKLNFKKMFLNPSLFFNKKKRNIKFHFDMMHGEGNLDKAISLLDLKEKNDFNDFVNSETSFNPHNMFICKKKK